MKISIFPKAFAMAVSAMLLTGVVHAQQWPSKPIKMVVPFAPGGGADITARVYADALQKILGQSIVVENKAGAGGAIGANSVASSPPDGYTFLYTTPGQQMTLPFLVKKLGYDPDALMPVSQVSLAPSVLVVNSKLGIKNLDQFISYAKSHPGKLSFVSAGIGSSSHLNGELLKSLAKIDVEHIPYKGTGEALRDLVGGMGDFSIDTVGIYTAYIKDGRLTPLGVTTPFAVDILPNVLSLNKTIPGFDASPVNYITAPRGTPDDIVRKMSGALNQAAKEPQVKSTLAAQGIVAVANTPDEMKTIVEKERRRWKGVIEDAGIQAQ